VVALLSALRVLNFEKSLSASILNYCWRYMLYNEQRNAG